MTMEGIEKTTEIIFGVAFFLGWIVGVIAWIRRGFGIPRPVHVTAGVLAFIGFLSAAIAFKIGIRSVGFIVFALLGFPAWAYAGWFLAGCPDQTGRTRTYRLPH